MPDYYQNDFGIVECGPRFAEDFPRRKNGQFDMRFGVVKRSLAEMKAAIEQAYMAGAQFPLIYNKPTVNHDPGVN